MYIIKYYTTDLEKESISKVIKRYDRDAIVNGRKRRKIVILDTLRSN